MTATDPGRRRAIATGLRGLAVDVAPLRVSREFRLLWCGELVSQVGGQCTVVALLVQVYRLTGSPAAVGFVGLVQLVPMIVCSIGLGPQLDRRDRRVLLAGAEVGLMAASGLLLFGALLGRPPLALVYGAAALNAALLTVAMPARAAITPNVVPAELLAPAAALNQVMWNTAGVVGPALGGVVIQAAGLSWAYGIDLVSYVAALAAALALGSQRPRPAGGGEEKGLAAVRTGLRYVRGKRVLQSTFTVDIVAMVFGMPRVLFPVLADRRFHLGAGGAGWFFSAAALGALLGALTSGWVGRVRRIGLAIVAAVAVWGAAIAAFGLVGDHLALALAFLAVAGAADVISAVFRNTLQQLVVPDGLRGRMAALNILVVTGGPRLGDVEGGLVASAFTPAFSVVSGGVLCLAGVAVITAAVPRFARWRVGDPP